MAGSYLGGTGTNSKRIWDIYLHNTLFSSNPSLFWSYFLPQCSVRAEQASSPLHVRETSEFGASCLRNLSTGDLPFLSPIPGFCIFSAKLFQHLTGSPQCELFHKCFILLDPCVLQMIYMCWYLCLRYDWSGHFVSALSMIVACLVVFP